MWGSWNFQKLILAPATLGLLAPIIASANEVTINDFNAAEEITVTNSRVDGLEARFNDFEAGGFSDTTVMEASAGFLIGATDSTTGSNDKAQFESSLKLT